MSDATVYCELCFRGCVIAPGESGNCRVRYNLNGELVSLTYGKPSAVHVDPIEKKPLYHFLPGTRAFSIATVGCQGHCLYCQNWELSQTNPEDAETIDLPPEKVASDAAKSGSKTVAYTYTEPGAYYEYTFDTAVLVKRRGLKNILVTAGYLNEKPQRELMQHIDGATITLKGNKKFYEKIVAASLKQVQRYIKTAVASKVHVEIVNLIVPTLNDSKEDLAWLIGWIASELGPNVPLHFLRFFPMYKLASLYPTPAGTLFDAARMAIDAGINYVYIGNLPNAQEFNNTRCPKCKTMLIERRGFLAPDVRLSNGSCPKCGEKIPGVWR